MKLIIGLGNPGLNFAKTRHNFGFMAVDQLKDELNVVSGWQINTEFQAALCETQVNQEKIILAKPQTMMNLSGRSIKILTDYHRIAAENIWVIHDDMDLPLGVLRLSQGSSSAGHKGVQSIIEALGTKDFVRFRLGIHPVGQTFFSAFFKRLTSTQKFVLKKFAKSEESIVQKTIKKNSEAIQLALKDGLAKAKSQHN